MLKLDSAEYFHFGGRNQNDISQIADAEKLEMITKYFIGQN